MSDSIEIEHEDDLPEDEYNKILGQYRLQLNGLLLPLRLYGQGQFVDMVSEQLVILGAQLHYKLIGIDTPYEVEVPHW